MFKFRKKFIIAITLIQMITPLVFGEALATEEEGLEYLLFADIPMVLVASKKAEKITDAPSVVTVITRREIQSYGANNLRDVFDRMPSMQAIGSQMVPETAISIRGQAFFHENNHVLVLINGRPFRDGLAQGYSTSLMSGIPIQLIERIEIIRGPGSVLYGTSAFSGVINVITRTAEESNTLNVDLTVGEFGTQNIEATVFLGDEDWDIIAGVKQWNSDGWDKQYTDQTNTLYDFETDEDNLGTFIDARYKNFRLNVFYGDCNQAALQPPGTGPVREENNENRFIDLSYVIPVSDQWSFQTSVTYNYLRIEDLELGTEGILVEETLNGTINEITNLVCGVTYENIDLYSPANWIQDEVNKSEQPLSAYLQVDHTFAEKVKVVVGVQYNKPVDAKDGFSPRLAFVFNFNEEFGLKLMHGYAYRSPNFLENYISSPGVLYGNPDLDPETVETSEIQLNYHGSKFIGSLTYYHSKIKDLITRVGFPINYENGGTYGDVEFDGIEFEGKLSLTDNLIIQGNSTYQTNESEYGIDEITFTPKLMVKLGILYKSENGFTFGCFDSYFGKPTDSQDLVPQIVPFVPEYNPEPKSYHLVTINASLNITKFFKMGGATEFIVELFVDNALDEEINFPDINAQHTNSYPIHSPRSIYGTLKVRY